jgi:hypothetical protein
LIRPLLNLVLNEGKEFGRSERNCFQFFYISSFLSKSFSILTNFSRRSPMHKACACTSAPGDEHCEGEIVHGGMDAAWGCDLANVKFFYFQKNNKGRQKTAGLSILHLSLYLPMSRFMSCSGPTQRTTGRAMSCMGKHPSHRSHLLFLFLF